MKLEIQKTNNLLKNGVQIKREFSIEEIQMAEKGLRKCSTSVFIMVIKTTLISSYNP